jgi:hypothetical protein
MMVCGMGRKLLTQARERPHLIFDGVGNPTHLISGAGDPGEGGNTGVGGADHTFTLVVPLGTVSNVG